MNRARADLERLRALQAEGPVEDLHSKSQCHEPKKGRVPRGIGWPESYRSLPCPADFDDRELRRYLVERRRRSEL